MKRYVVPGYYHVVTRLPTPRIALFWTFNLLGVISLVAWSAAAMPLHDFAVVLFLGLGAWQSLYEIGYLENDLIATQREQKPTLRLDASTRARLTAAYGRLVAAKWLVSSALFVALVLYGQWRGLDLNLTAFATWLLALRLVYLVHNSIRSRMAIATFALLQLMKYGALPLLVLASERSLFYLAVAAIPVPLTVLEYASLPRFAFKRLQLIMRPFPTSRVVYYLVVSSGAAVVWWFGPSPLTHLALALALGMLCFRALAWWWLYHRGPADSGLRRQPRGPAGVDDG